MSNTPRRKPTPPKHLKRFQKKMRKATNTSWKLTLDNLDLDPNS